MNLSNGESVSRVLIADDDPVIRHWLTWILEVEGYRVVAMNDGREAYRLLQGDANFAGAVLDMSMPYLEGSDLIRFMRTEKRLMRIPVMLITAESDIKLVVSGFAAGATILLPKPFTRKRLQQMLRLMLRSTAVSKPTSAPSNRKAFTGRSEDEPLIGLPPGKSAAALAADLEAREAEPLVQGPVDLSLLTSLEDDDGSVDSDLLVELIDLYLGSAGRQVSEIKAIAAEKDRHQLKELAHALKGSSLTMGANRVAELCAQLEQEKMRDSAGTVGLVQKLESAFSRTAEIFRGERQKRITPVAA
jgi:DNA-binding response OmpR family regulator/HPt (histidine-containing phosphotransfer) domain-containing protein